jgi:hypothetical protein
VTSIQSFFGCMEHGVPRGISGGSRRCRKCFPTVTTSNMTITAATMLALWTVGFAAGYGIRSYRSYRRRKRGQLKRFSLPSSRPAFTQFDNVGARESEHLPRVRTSPPTMVE